MQQSQQLSSPSSSVQLPSSPETLLRSMISYPQDNNTDPIPYLQQEYIQYYQQHKQQQQNSLIPSLTSTTTFSSPSSSTSSSSSSNNNYYLENINYNYLYNNNDHNRLLSYSAPSSPSGMITSYYTTIDPQLDSTNFNNEPSNNFYATDHNISSSYVQQQPVGYFQPNQSSFDTIDNNQYHDNQTIMEMDNNNDQLNGNFSNQPDYQLSLIYNNNSNNFTQNDNLMMKKEQQSTTTIDCTASSIMNANIIYSQTGTTTITNPTTKTTNNNAIMTPPSSPDMETSAYLAFQKKMAVNANSFEPTNSIEFIDSNSNGLCNNNYSVTSLINDNDNDNGQHKMIESLPSSIANNSKSPMILTTKIDNLGANHGPGATRIGLKRGRGNKKSSSNTIGSSVTGRIDGIKIHKMTTSTSDATSINPSSNKQTQKRTAHLSAEFRYRTKLNEKINKLKSLVSKQKHNLSKSAVLTRSIDMIIHLKRLVVQYHQANLQLQQQLHSPNLHSPTTTTTLSSPSLSLKEVKTMTKNLSTQFITTNLNNNIIKTEQSSTTALPKVDISIKNEPIDSNEQRFY